MNEAIAILFSVLVSEVNARYDAHLIKKGKYINHRIRSVVRGVLFVSVSVLACGFTWAVVPLLAILCSVFWITFDIRMSNLRGLYWLYVGKTSEMDVFARSVFGFKVGKVYLVVKCVVLVISVVLYLVLKG